MTPLFTLLRRHLGTMSLFALIAAGVTAVVVSRLPARVQVVVPFTVPIPDRPASAEYEFDGFYALQATDLFAGTLEGWLSSPDVVAAVYARADLPLPASSVRRLGKVFAARKVSGQIVELQFQAGTREEATRLVDAVAGVVTERTTRFNEEGRSSLAFRVLPEQPLIVPVRRSAPLRAAVAAVVTFVVSVSVLILWDAMQHPLREEESSA